MKREYKCQGLVVDTDDGRLVLCQTGVCLYRWIAIGVDEFGLVANRLSELERYIPSQKISRADVIAWLAESGRCWLPKRIMYPKKIRIVCS